ncbi:DUF2177 family protein [Rhizobacter sp. AJA081-3]|jgi:uncharacterized membrane protein|uniref:DUF2177 family protein n=1 Tax=Rhizobacter sp. AJA081-3 TaxID=2753607 RepID=UPI001ADF5B50|nr:DUF2177 family protein [Rhizobacter sp. AJA081-3]QTN21102.1 DUF2177 family protein [Rhizobacter sp. AJA081-3]
MTKYVAAYAATALVMLVLDAIWLGLIAAPLYQQGIGHLMAPQPRLGVAAIFYLLYPLGIVIFAVAARPAGAWQPTLLAGALFGFFAYATYDLTNLATLKGWPIGLSLVDVAWGSAVSAVSAGAGRWAMDRLDTA